MAVGEGAGVAVTTGVGVLTAAVNGLEQPASTETNKSTAKDLPGYLIFIRHIPNCFHRNTIQNHLSFILGAAAA